MGTPAVNRLISVKEMAEILGVPASWVYERTCPSAREKLPHIRAGKYIRFDPEEVLRYLRDATTGADGEDGRRQSWHRG